MGKRKKPGEIERLLAEEERDLQRGKSGTLHPSDFIRITYGIIRPVPLLSRLFPEKNGGVADKSFLSK